MAKYGKVLSSTGFRSGLCSLGLTARVWVSDMYEYNGSQRNKHYVIMYDTNNRVAKQVS